MKVFVGYASEDRSAAEEVVGFLKTLGLDVWFDRSSLVAGDDWDAERLAAQRDADIIIHMCSDKILTRPGVVNREIRETLRLAEDKPFGSNFAIFIRLGEVRLPATFLRYHYIDFEGDWQQALATAVGKKAGSLQMDSAPATPYKRDSVNVLERFSKRLIEEKEKTYELSVEYLVYGSGDTYWRMINSHIESKALEEYYSFKSAIPSLSGNSDEEWFRAAEFQLRTEEFYCSSGFVSLRYSMYWDMGGAHGNFRTATSNFFGLDHGKFTIKDALHNDEEKAKKLLSYCMKVVGAGLGDEDVDWLVDKDNSEEAWRVLDNFNFDNRGVTFNFSPYDLLAYAYGDHEVNIPWQVALNFFSEEYGKPWGRSEVGESS
ncbi:TIR domain-containing protein [Pararhizobium sp.]|uniref:TIR domain-containing protein n=1 Tax=Pararhizobium sp. TaxID=1977563 RepID=UPI003D0FAE52